MFWFIVPLIIVVAIIAITVWIMAVAAKRKGGDGMRVPGRTVYDENEKKSPDAPPA